MTLEISQLMDGELDNPAAASLIAMMKQDPALRQDWAVYHLAGDSMRQAGFFSPGLAARVGERLASEPTVLAPRRALMPKRAKRFALSAVAAVAAVAVVAWVGLRGPAEVPVAQIASAPAPAAAVPTRLPMQARINDYLLAHQEYSPSTTVHGVGSYARTVALSTEGTGR
ncbi:MAG TPA: sigma-E factor negative regulatory protein [Burkholderiales bacterium]|nr:sigma-E factor negative regulatory protein [Burkholderiales bacterium]